MIALTTVCQQKRNGTWYEGDGISPCKELLGEVFEPESHNLDKAVQGNEDT